MNHNRTRMIELAKIANRLDRLGLPAVANQVEQHLQKIALEEMSTDTGQSVDTGQSRVGDQPTPAAPPAAKTPAVPTRSPLEEQTIKLQQLLNNYLPKLKRKPLTLTGKNDQATQAALQLLGISESDYANWPQLFQLVTDKGRQLVNAPARRESDPAHPFYPELSGKSRPAEEPMV